MHAEPFWNLHGSLNNAVWHKARYLHVQVGYISWKIKRSFYRNLNKGTFTVDWWLVIIMLFVTKSVIQSAYLVFEGMQISKRRHGWSWTYPIRYSILTYMISTPVYRLKFQIDTITEWKQTSSLLLKWKKLMFLSYKGKRVFRVELNVIVELKWYVTWLFIPGKGALPVKWLKWFSDTFKHFLVLNHMQ